MLAVSAGDQTCIYYTFGIVQSSARLVYLGADVNSVFGGPDTVGFEEERDLTRPGPHNRCYPWNSELTMGNGIARSATRVDGSTTVRMWCRVKQTMQTMWAGRAPTTSDIGRYEAAVS